MEEELEIFCPFCGESISVLVDVFIPQQSYIEDCTVCCRPIQFRITCEDGVVTSTEIGRS
ncbi:MAG: CPXCG motif-containing cysteine-rich protein [Pseudomonadota bacterium]|nr:CPXCG motif-containing cysteine-rich protein [Pseudomonadota bacterium]